MAIFATPDFGASAFASLCLLVAWAVVLAAVAACFFWATKLLRKDSPKTRKYGVALLVVCGLVPLACCQGPALFVRVFYGNFPLGRYPDNKIKEGMSGDEVVATLGTPHNRITRNDGETWYYWIDSFNIYWFGVDFGPDGRVTHTYGN